MKTGFKDRTAIKNQDRKDYENKSNDSIWNFKCPQYDQRSSCFINAGTKYGVGHAQPIGKFEANPTGAVPYGRINTLETDEEA